MTRIESAGQTVIVSRRQLESSLARVASMVEHPRAGILDRRSLSWHVNRESIALLGGGAAALLQLAHPYVAHAVADHSRTRDDVLGRFRRTFTHVLAMVFGNLEQALDTARRLHAIHHRIRGHITEDVGRYRRGHPYHANDVDALFWVHATLVATALDVFERVVRPLSALERELYYRDGKRFAYLFGIPDSAIPDDYGAFEAYLGRMFDSDTLAVGTAARAMARFLLHTDTPWQAPIFRGYRAVTAVFLPARFRRVFGLEVGRLELAGAHFALRRAGLLYRALPDRLRYFDEYLQARLDPGARVRHRPNDAIQRLVHGLLG